MLTVVWRLKATCVRCLACCAHVLRMQELQALQKSHASLKLSKEQLAWDAAMYKAKFEKVHERDQRLQLHVR